MVVEIFEVVMLNVDSFYSQIILYCVIGESFIFLMVLMDSSFFFFIKSQTY